MGFRASGTYFLVCPVFSQAPNPCEGRWDRDAYAEGGLAARASSGRLNWENVTGFIPRISRDQRITTALAGLRLHILGRGAMDSQTVSAGQTAFQQAGRRVWDSNPR